MPVPAGTWAKILLYFQGLGKEWSNVFWYTTVDSFVGGFNQYTLAGAFYSKLVTTLLPPMSSEVSVQGLNLEIRNGSNTYGVDYYNQSGGGDSSPALPEDVAVVVQRLSDTAGRSGRGRIYIAGCSQDQSDGSYLTPAGVALFQTWCGDVRGAVTNQSQVWSPAVHSQKTNALHALVSAQTTALLGTTRRRRPRF